MRKFLLASLMLMAMVSPVVAKDLSGYLNLTTTYQDITLEDVYWIAIHPRSAPVYAFTYNSIQGTDTNIDVVYVEAGVTQIIMVSGMDYVRLVRVSDTHVDYAMSTFKEATPSIIPSVYGMTTDIGTMDDNVDSLLIMATQPTVVSVSTHDLFSGITLKSGVAGSATNLNAGWKTFPLAGAPCVDGAKSIMLQLSWLNFQHGGFKIQHVFAASATDTAALWSRVDSCCVTDSTALSITGTHTIVHAITADVAGTANFDVPVIPGAGYYFCRIYPWGKAHASWITGLTGTLRVV